MELAAYTAGECDGNEPEAEKAPKRVGRGANRALGPGCNCVALRLVSYYTFPSGRCGVEILVENIGSSPTAVQFNEDAQTLNRSLSHRPGRDGSEYRLTSPLQVALHYMRSGEDLLFDGTLSADLAGQCARCLEEFPLALSRPFSWVLLPASPQGVFGRETELNQEDLAASFYSGDSVDVSLLVREQFFLSLPSSPLCQETCKGLCEQCGVNLNSEECSCPPGWADLRLAALASLRLPTRRASSRKTEKAHS